MTYDGATRVATVNTGGDRHVTTTLDTKGRPVRRTVEGAADPMTFRWNAAGRVDRITQGTRVATMTYDPDHPFRVLTRSDGTNTTAFTYDDAERVKTIKLPSTATYTFGYDADGNRTSVTMPNGQHPRLRLRRARPRDPLHTVRGLGLRPRVRRRRHRHRLHAARRRRRDAPARASGRLTGATSPDGTSSTFSYAAGDKTDRLATTTRSLPGSRSDETRLGYDGTLVTSKQSRDAGGAYATSSYAYDDRLNLERIALSAGTDSLTEDISYDADGLVTGQGPFTFDRGGPAGQTSEVTSDKLSLAIGYASTGIENKRTTTVDGNPVFDTEITRNTGGRITKKVESIAGGADVTYTYTYFPDGQLKSVTGGPKSETYTYDVNGNRLSAKYGSAAAETATYSADDQMSRRNGVTHTYDLAGHLTGIGADTFDYSDDGELLEATVGGTNVKYVYDSAGRRVARTEGGQTTRFIYGDPRRPLLVTATRAPGGELTTYSYDADDLLFSLRRGGQRYYVATDQVGTPRAVADEAGAIVATYSYDAYGIRGASTGTFGDLPIGFAGGIEDPVTKLVRFGLRDYDPAAGRWTARDPIYQAGGLNTYAYVGGDPVAGRDPMGLEGFWSGLVTSVSNFFTNEHTGTALETINSVAGDTALGEAAGTLNDGIGKVQQVQEVLDTALELKEASEQPTDPEQAAGYLKCGLKWIKKILPIDLVGTEAAAAVLDKGMEHARDQRDTGTINQGAQRQLAELGMN